MGYDGKTMGFLKTYVLTTHDRSGQKGKFVCRTLELHDVASLGKRIHSNGGFMSGFCWYPVSSLILIQGMGAVDGMTDAETKVLLKYSQDRYGQEGIVPFDMVMLEAKNAAE